jgi:class 3 adenylate cyclase
MQRAMDQFAQITTAHGSFSLQMRVGIHTGRFLRADIGTPRRMEHVLLGGVVQRTKQAEGAGRVGRVCLTPEVAQLAADRFRYEPGQEGHVLVIDDLTPTDLGEYEVAIMQRRSAGPLLIDLSSQSVMAEIERALTAVEPLASYLPQPVLQMLIESAAHRRIPPDFPEPTVMFIHLIGLVEAVDHAPVGSETVVVGMFSRVLALINAAIEAQGGVLKKITCHRYGYDMTIYFGVPNAHTNDPMRAAHAALAIRRLIMELAPVTFAAQPFTLICKIGLSQGPTFAAEIGEPRGRREFNVLGSTVNIAARLMEKAAANQILMTESVYQAIPEEFQVQALGLWMLKGKQQPVPVFSLQGSEQGGSAENLSIGLC